MTFIEHWAGFRTIRRPKKFLLARPDSNGLPNLLEVYIFQFFPILARFCAVWMVFLTQIPTQKMLSQLYSATFPNFLLHFSLQFTPRHSGFILSRLRNQNIIEIFPESFPRTKKIEGDVGVNANYLSHASNSLISSSLAIRFTDDVVIPRNRDAEAPCIQTSASPPDIIFSSPSQPGPAGHPVSLVSAFPLTYTFSYLLSCIISLCTNVPTASSLPR